METVANLAVAAIALLHVYILVLEMFLWTKPAGRRAFGTDAEFARASATLAANQGLYNGFLAAGLVWGLVAGDPVGFPAKVFFLICVIVAGVYGAVTVNRRILFVQAVPAAVALALVVLARQASTTLHRALRDLLARRRAGLVVPRCRPPSRSPWSCWLAKPRHSPSRTTRPAGPTACRSRSTRCASPTLRRVTTYCGQLAPRLLEIVSADGKGRQCRMRCPSHICTGHGQARRPGSRSAATRDI